MIATDYSVAHIFIKYKSGQCEQIAFHLTNKFQARHRPNSIVSSIKRPVRFYQTIYILYFRLFICEFIVYRVECKCCVCGAFVKYSGGKSSGKRRLQFALFASNSIRWTMLMKMINRLVSRVQVHFRRIQIDFHRYPSQINETVINVCKVKRDIVPCNSFSSHLSLKVCYGRRRRRRHRRYSTWSTRKYNKWLCRISRIFNRKS